MRLEVETLFDILIPSPFNFALTVAKPAGWHWSTPREQFENGVLWSGVYLANEPIGLRMSSQGNRVRVTAFSRLPLTAEEHDTLDEILRYGLGADEDLSGFYRFARKDRILSRTTRDLNGMRMGLVDDVFGAASLAILLQMAPMTRSDRMMDAFLEYYGNRAEFDGHTIILWPGPQDIAGVDPDELRRTANMGYRAKWIVRAAQYLSENPVSLLQLSKLPTEESTRRLMEIPGIGKYSAGIILGQTSLPIDAWSVVIMSELFLGHTPAHPRKEIEQVISELTARWGRWSWFAFVYVVNDLENLAPLYHLSRIS